MLFRRLYLGGWHSGLLYCNVECRLEGTLELQSQVKQKKRKRTSVCGIGWLQAPKHSCPCFCSTITATITSNGAGQLHWNLMVKKNPASFFLCVWEAVHHTWRLLTKKKKKSCSTCRPLAASANCIKVQQSWAPWHTKWRQSNMWKRVNDPSVKLARVTQDKESFLLLFVWINQNSPFPCLENWLERPHAAF